MFQIEDRYSKFPCCITLIFVMKYTDKYRKDVVTYRGNVISIDVSKEDRPTIEGSVFVFHDLTIRKIWDGQKIPYKLTVQHK